MSGLLNLCLYQLRNPSGNKVNVTITVCSLDGQSGICLLKKLSVTPWVRTGTADIFFRRELNRAWGSIAELCRYEVTMASRCNIYPSGKGNLAQGGLR